MQIVSALNLRGSAYHQRIRQPTEDRSLVVPIVSGWQSFFIPHFFTYLLE